jgi:hypothetical protein
LVIVGLILLIVIAAVFMRGRGAETRKFSEDEETIRSLVREVNADKITNEDVKYKDGDVILAISQRDSNLANLEVNLSSLARKHREQRVSLPVIRKSLQF